MGLFGAGSCADSRQTYRGREEIEKTARLSGYVCERDTILDAVVSGDIPGDLVAGARKVAQIAADCRRVSG